MKTKHKTCRGFTYGKFQDLYNQACSIQESSLATEHAIWLGVDDAIPKILASKIIQGGTGWAEYPIPDDVHITTRMHLDQLMAKELIKELQRFVDTGLLS